ncbi:MAG TPA: rhodanese-like domain-containing protein [Bacteroidota bacterium]|nr:rhodanese-like domain-containing protein [Bacteroidota bacterium]
MLSQLVFYAVSALVVLFGVRHAWIARSVPRVKSAEAEKEVHSGQAVFLDVRTESEWQSEHIKGSIHIPLHTLRRRAEELSRYSNKQIICYCQSGNRSVRAAHILRTRGLRASSLEGGIGEWNFFTRLRR